jgi:PST family polysaccharide transporter
MDIKNDKENVIRGISSQTLVTFLIGLVDILSFSIMSRLLNSKDFGYYAAIVAVSMVFSSLAENGIGSAIVQQKKLNKEYVDCAFTMSLIIGVLITLLMCFSSNFLASLVADETMTVPLMIYSITLLCSCVTSVNNSLMQRNLHFLRIGLVNLSSLVITTIIAIFLAWKGYGYYAILAKGVLASILTMILSYYASKAKYKISCNFLIYKQIWSFSGWLMASALLRNFANQADRLMMSSLFSVSTLGLYSRPKEFVASISAKINYIFDSVLFPVLSSFQDSKTKMQKSFLDILYFMNLLGMILSILFFFNSELIIRLFLGEEWVSINYLFQILAFSPALFVIGRVGDIYLRALGLTKSQFFFRLGQLILTVVFIIVSYKRGIVAVAFATMIAYFIIATSKILYISFQICCTNKELFLSFIKGWYPILYYLLPYVVCLLIIPHDWVGNIIQVIVFLIVTIVIFILYPSLIGEKYQSKIYLELLNYSHKITSKLWN